VQLTIVIPTFNAANFISETLTRVKGFATAEILILDDGSTDDTIRVSKIIMNGHQNYGVFRLTHKGSPGQARNLGLQLARGKWVWFLDCDDVPIVNNVDNVLEVAGELQSTVCILGYLVRYDQGVVWGDSFDKNLFTKLCPSSYAIFSRWVLAPEIVRLSPHPSRNIYSREFLISRGLVFDVDENFEDGSFWPKALFLADNILLWNWPTTMYRVRNNSVTYSRELGRKLFLLTQFEKIFTEIGFRDSPFKNLWGATYLYGLEMISWPLSTLDSTMRAVYRKEARKVLDSVGGKWFVNSPTLNRKDRITIVKALLRFNCKRLALLCLIRVFR